MSWKTRLSHHGGGGLANFNLPPKREERKGKKEGEKVLEKNKSTMTKNKVRLGNNPYSILNYNEDEDPALRKVSEPKTRQNVNHCKPIEIRSE